MKAKRGKPKSPKLHRADPEVGKALAMPARKRRSGRNRHVKVEGGPFGPRR